MTDEPCHPACPVCTDTTPPQDWDVALAGVPVDPRTGTGEHLMGLDVGQAHWSYGGFARFRDRLAEHEDCHLRLMEGFGGTHSWDQVGTPIKPLLNHSDCDGELTSAECAQVAPRLSQILDEWDNGSYDYDVEQGRVLIEAMQEAAESGEPLEFS